MRANLASSPRSHCTSVRVLLETCCQASELCCWMCKFDGYYCLAYVNIANGTVTISKGCLGGCDGWRFGGNWLGAGGVPSVMRLYFHYSRGLNPFLEQQHLSLSSSMRDFEILLLLLLAPPPPMIRGAKANREARMGRRFSGFRWLLV